VPPSAADLVAGHLDAINRLGLGTPAEQAEIAEAARSAFLAEPSATHRLRYALVMATPGHGRADPVGARTLLGEALSAPERLTEPERALAQIVYRDLNNLLALELQVRELDAAAKAAASSRDVASGRRIQALAAENDRLRRELEEAREKLEAVAELEKALVERHNTQGPSQ
jgi:hypothetical protein